MSRKLSDVFRKHNAPSSQNVSQRFLVVLSERRSETLGKYNTSFKKREAFSAKKLHEFLMDRRCRQAMLSCIAWTWASVRPEYSAIFFKVNSPALSIFITKPSCAC